MDRCCSNHGGPAFPFQVLKSSPLQMLVLSLRKEQPCSVGCIHEARRWEEGTRFPRSNLSLLPGMTLGLAPNWDGASHYGAAGATCWMGGGGEIPAVRAFQLGIPRGKPHGTAADSLPQCKWNAGVQFPLDSARRNGHSRRPRGSIWPGKLNCHLGEETDGEASSWFPEVPPLTFPCWSSSATKAPGATSSLVATALHVVATVEGGTTALLRPLVTPTVVLPPLSHHP